MKKTPDVTIVLAHYNDGVNVHNAIKSAYAQTHKNIELILVDDCSNDGSADVARDVVEADTRGTFHQLEYNSGGVGGPRRRGLELARGDYVLFLDSDDVLDRHACKNLLRAGKESGADITMAKTRRFEVEKSAWRGWHDRLYSEPVYYSSIEDNPDLSIDTIVVSKLYRTKFLREHQITFPTDIHYEDLVFSALSFSKADGIQVISESAYIWKIYPNDIRKSITNQRDSISNLEYRIEALKRVSSVINYEDNPKLLDRLRLKALRHDARLYLNDLRQADDEFAKLILVTLKPFLETIPRATYKELEYQERFLYGAALSLEPEKVREAFGLVYHRATLIPPAKLDKGCLLWHPELVTKDAMSDLQSELLRLPLEFFERVPWHQYKFFNVVESAALQGQRVNLRVKTFDPLHKLGHAGITKVSIRLFTRGKGTQVSFSEIGLLENNDEWLEWEGNFTLPSEWDYTNIQKIGLRVVFENNLAAVEGHLIFPKNNRLKKNTIAPAFLGARTAGFRYRLYRTVDGTLGLRKAKIGKNRRFVDTIVAPAFSARFLVMRSMHQPVRTNSLRWKVAYLAMRLLPLQQKNTLFESHMGKSSVDSPRAIFDALMGTCQGQVATWSFERNHRAIYNFESAVVRHSARYLYALARSKYLVDNQSFPSYFRKRKNQVYLQTWHGIPLKVMGFDEPNFKRASLVERSTLSARVSNWDYLSTPSPYFESTFVPAFGFKNELICYGSPRNDTLVNSTSSQIEDIKIRLGFDLNTKIVLYAPTFRSDSRNSRRPIKLEIDLEEWSAALGDDCVLMVRPHYLNKLSIHPKFAGRIIDVSNIEDIASLYLISDLLITDYSSVMFDYATLDRPIVIYAYDLEKYVNEERGTYFSIEEYPPGVIVSDQSQLHDSVRARLSDDPDGDLRAIFNKRFSGNEPGNISEITVARVWGVK